MAPGLHGFLNKEKSPCQMWGRDSDMEEPGDRKHSLALQWVMVSSWQRQSTGQLAVSHVHRVPHTHHTLWPFFSVTSCMGSSAPCTSLNMTSTKVSLRPLTVFCWQILDKDTAWASPLSPHSHLSRSLLPGPPKAPWPFKLNVMGWIVSPHPADKGLKSWLLVPMNVTL